MRLEGLDIGGFARLRDVSVSFHPRVTVILGDNESGKTTLHRVIRAGLYSLDAGGQGRPVERSDWARHQPWTPGPYAFTMTLVCDDGRRLRIAARLDDRDQHIQVVELGGGDITASMRSGRIVAPGRHVLGVDEQVFCATAWLGDDGLRPGAPDSAQQRARGLQEAIERLADSGRGTTAAEAIARLKSALDRVGSERRSQSPLGVATAQVRRLESDIEAVRRRGDAFAAEQEQLRELETIADLAAARRLECERAWLVGRLAALGSERLETQRAAAEVADLQNTVALTAHAANVRIEDEAVVIALAGEWRQAAVTAAAASARWEAAAPEMHAAQRRRHEIASGLAAMGDIPDVGDTTVHERNRLGAELDAARDQLKRLGDTAGITARADALRREIAATGLGAIRIGGADSVASLVTAARNRGRSRTANSAAGLAAATAMAGAIFLGASRHTVLGAVVAGVGLAVTLALLAAGWFAGGAAVAARRQLLRLSPDIDTSDIGLERMATRLPALRALHDDLLRQEVRAAEQRDQMDRLAAEISDINVRAQRAVERLGQASDDIDFVTAGDHLDILDTLIEASARRRLLLTEDAALAITEASLTGIAEAAEAARSDVAMLAASVRTRLGPIVGDGDIDEAVSAFSVLCASRRRHDVALAHLTGLRPRREDDGHLAEVAARLSRDLLLRGGDPASAATAAPLDEAALSRLEREVETSRTRAEAASLQAAQLRSRLGASLEGLPNLADLEDELTTCRGARDRALRQRAALERAIELIETSTRGVHRDLAPRLAESITGRLAQLTAGRYTSVNVDTDHFAISLSGRERPDLVPLEQVSHGTRDQVALLLRLALAEVLSDSGESLPLFLDEPLLSADPQRRAATLEFLCDLSARHQVVVTTSDPDLATEVTRRLGADAAVVTMAPVTPEMTVRGIAVRMPQTQRP